MLNFIHSNYALILNKKQITSDMANFQRIKELDKSGELMLKLGSGEKLELHKHNVSFDDTTQEIKVDAGTETYWISSDFVVYYWIHREGVEKE